MSRLDSITAALREIEQAATGSGILQPGAAYALGALAEACNVQPGDTAADVAAVLTAAAVTCPHCNDEFDGADQADGDVLVVCSMCAKAGRPAAPPDLHRR
jgi:formylmethanofuran dehydrogenase subunit E